MDELYVWTWTWTAFNTEFICASALQGIHVVGVRLMCVTRFKTWCWYISVEIITFKPLWLAKWEPLQTVAVWMLYFSGICFWHSNLQNEIKLQQRNKIYTWEVAYSTETKAHHFFPKTQIRIKKKQIPKNRIKNMKYWWDWDSLVGTGEEMYENKQTKNKYDFCQISTILLLQEGPVDMEWKKN